MQDKEKVVMGEETSYGPSREAVSYAHATNKAKSNVITMIRKPTLFEINNYRFPIIPESS